MISTPLILAIANHLWQSTAVCIALLSNANQAQALLAFATLYSGNVKIFQTGVVQANRITNDQLKTVPLNLELNLSGVPPDDTIFN